MSEKKILIAILKKMESEKLSFVSRPGFKPLLWLVIAITTLTMYGYREDETINTLVVITVSMLVGCFVGATALANSAEQQWPAIKNHINKGSIEARIEELNT